MFENFSSFYFSILLIRFLCYAQVYSDAEAKTINFLHVGNLVKAYQGDYTISSMLMKMLRSDTQLLMLMVPYQARNLSVDVVCLYYFSVPF